MILTSDSIDQFLVSLRANGMSENTLRAYRADLRSHVQWWVSESNHSLDALLTLDQLEMRMKLHLNSMRLTAEPRTIARKRAAFRKYLAWMGRPDPLMDLRVPTPAELEPHPLPNGVDDLQKMFDVTYNARQRALLALCGLCGVRVSEAVTVQVCDVEDDPPTVRVLGKGSKVRYVPVSDAAWPYLSARLEQCDGSFDRLVGTGERAARALVSRLAQRAGIGHVASHDLRMTFGTDIFARSLDIVATQKLLGHSRIETTQGYVKRTQDELRAAVNLPRRVS